MIAAWNRLFSIFQNRASKTSFNTPKSRLWSKYTHCAASPISAELLKKVGECRNPSLEENALPVSEQLPGAFQLEFKCWLSVELFQWSFSSGAFPVGLFQWLIFLWLLVWRCPKVNAPVIGAPLSPVELFLSPGIITIGFIWWDDGMMFHQPGMRCSSSGSRWKMPQAPSVEHPYR